MTYNVFGGTLNPAQSNVSCLQKSMASSWPAEWIFAEA